MQISVQNKTYSQLINNKYQQNLGYHISLRKLPKPTKKFIYRQKNFQFPYIYHNALA